MREVWLTRRVFTPPVISCFVVAAFCAVVFMGMVISNRTTTNSVRMAETNSIEYRVNLRSGNGVTSNPYLDMGLTYAFDIIDNIEINNTYESELSSPVAVRYDYEATVSFVARVAKEDQGRTDKVIVDEVIETLQKSSSEQPQGDFSMTEAVSLNLAKYRKKYLEAESNLDFAITGEIRVDFIMNTVRGEDDSNAYARSVVIPVSEPYFQIDLEGEEKQDTGSSVAKGRSKTKTFTLFIVGAGAAGAFLLGAYLVVNPLRRKTSRKREIDRMLKSYRDMIIVATTPINPAAYKERVTVKDSKEILKLAANLNEPIIYYEAQEVACFYIPKDGTLYAYLINK